MKNSKKLLKNKFIIGIMAGVLSVMMLSGCSNKNETDLQKAYNSITNLEYEEALDYIEKAAASGEKPRLVDRAKGLAYMGQTRYPEAIECFEKALSESSGIIEKMDYDVNYYLAVAYYKNSNLDEALAIYDNILALKPKEVDALYLKGVLCAEKERLDEAKSCFEKAIALNPDNYDMLINIYVILQDNGYKEVGLEYLKNAMEKGSKKMTNYEKGQISYYLEDYDSARTYLEKAKDEERDNDGAVLLLGNVYEKQGDIPYAISVYSSYANSSAASARIFNQMGVYKMRSGDYIGALADFKQALNSADNDVLKAARFNEIIAFEYIGDFAQARSLMENYVKQYPDDMEAKREYTFLKTR